jgi:hypothetical protein
MLPPLRAAGKVAADSDALKSEWIFQEEVFKTKSYGLCFFQSGT